MEDLMTGHVTSDNTLNKRIVERASSYRHILGDLRDKLENGMLCLKNVAIDHNGGQHCILVRDLTMDRALGVLIDAVVEKFSKMNDIEITISRDDIAEKERFNYSYIVVVQQEKVKAELPY
jgi:hypothetical protein